MENQKNIVFVPANTERLMYNGYQRDFYVERLDFGRIAFVKSNERNGRAPLCFCYDTRQGDPFFYTCAILSPDDTLKEAD